MLARVLGVSTSDLLEETEPGVGPTRQEHPVPAGADDDSLLRGHQDELRKLLDSLASTSGPYFWLVVSPPQFGKTWFLNQIRIGLEKAEPSRWVMRLVDAREHPPAAGRTADTLLARLFGLADPIAPISDVLRTIATQIIAGQKSHLCLLDGAEDLDQPVAAALRSHLGQIQDLVQSGGDADLRVAFVVASRRDDEWRGVVPGPRMSLLPLAECSVYVVQQALRELGRRMNRSFGTGTYQSNASRVHGLTDGLPALLIRCLEWIRDQQWVGMDRLESQELFDEFAKPYIDDVLLSDASLFPQGRDASIPARQALEQAVRALAPYRLFTQSHVRHHLETDQVFQNAVRDVGWSTEKLWSALSSTALLRRPLDDPWQELHAAIRRLLYRYYYRTDEQRAQAHRDAREFVAVWSDKQSGKERVIGLVECLWHEISALRLARSPDSATTIESARELSLALRPSAAYTARELRAYAVDRMIDDQEFQETAAFDPELAVRLTTTVASPQEVSAP